MPISAFLLVPSYVSQDLLLLVSMKDIPIKTRHHVEMTCHKWQFDGGHIDGEAT